MMDVERVEVLRGPQGTLYGRNATGGVINVVMVQPKDSFEVYGGVLFGNYNARTFKGVVNVPVTNNLAFRVSGIKENRDEYLKGAPEVPFHESISCRIKARYNPSDHLTLTGTVAYSKVEETPFLTYIYPYSNLDTDDPWYYPDALDPGNRVDVKKSSSYSISLD